MGMETQNDVTEDENENYEDEEYLETNGEVYLEAFISSLKELRKLRKKHQ